MEYRKLISFGKNSFVVSLPKAWVKQKNLQKGDLIYINEDKQNLILSPQQVKEKNLEKEITIPVDGKSVRRIQRDIVSAYIKDYNSITLIGEEIKDKAKEIQGTIQNLMALEVMEQTSRKIVAKDFLNMNSISIQNIMRKIDIIVRAMMEDCEKMFEEDNSENIALRDNDVNRLSFLVFRYVEFGLNNSSLIYKKHQLTSQKLMSIWRFAFNIEGIGDEVKRIARYLKEMKLDQKQRKRFLNLLAEIKKVYLKMMKGFYNEDAEIAHLGLELKDQLFEEAEQFYEDNRKVKNIGPLIEKVKSKIAKINSLGRVVYQASFAEEGLTKI